MPQQDSNKASVAFCDVATYFSEEDWTRLHEWQKELYKNVMNEIHQALISLGPLIANSVVSLRTKDKEDHCPMDHEGRERNDLSSRFPNHYPDTSVSMEDQLNTGVSPLENKGRETSSRAGHMFNTSVVSCRMKEERACYPMHNQDSERSDDIISPLGDTNNNGALSAVQGVGHQNPVNPPNSKEIAQHDCFKSDEEEGFPFLSVDFCMRKEEQSSAVLIDDVHPESRESSSDPSSELPPFPVVVSLNIKEEEDAYSMDQQPNPRGGNNISPVAIQTWKQARMSQERIRCKVAQNRLRKPKFSEGELVVLTDEVVAHSDELYGIRQRKTSAQRRTAIWHSISQKVTAVASVPRDGEDCHKRWTDLRVRVRGLLSQHHQKSLATGGGTVEPLVLTTWEEKCSTLLNMEGTEGVGGVEVCASSQGAGAIRTWKQARMSQERIRCTVAQNRLRKPKFREGELVVLTDEVVAHSDELYGIRQRKTSAQRRTAIWHSIGQKVTAVASVPRDGEDCRKRWNDLRIRVRGLLSQHQQESLATGGGTLEPLVLTTWEEKCSTVLYVEGTEGIVGAEAGASNQEAGGTQPFPEASEEDEGAGPSGSGASRPSRFTTTTTPTPQRCRQAMPRLMSRRETPQASRIRPMSTSQPIRTTSWPTAPTPAAGGSDTDATPSCRATLETQGDTSPVPRHTEGLQTPECTRRRQRLPTPESPHRRHCAQSPESPQLCQRAQSPESPCCCKLAQSPESPRHCQHAQTPEPDIDITSYGSPNNTPEPLHSPPPIRHTPASRTVLQRLEEMERRQREMEVIGHTHSEHLQAIRDIIQGATRRIVRAIARNREETAASTAALTLYAQRVREMTEGVSALAEAICESTEVTLQHIRRPGPISSSSTTPTDESQQSTQHRQSQHHLRPRSQGTGRGGKRPRL
ncbi:uncharacterized protein [Ambystoma mexicanum]|uniref:uncharacterized protein isoform X2 n=1 Tax=Ambystoma mexicanum TaxID=8296 RepID=UPI0037E7AB2D